MLNDLMNGTYTENVRLPMIPVSVHNTVSNTYEPHENIIISNVYLEKDTLCIDFEKEEEGEVVAKSTIKIIKDYTLKTEDYNNSPKDVDTLYNDCLNFRAQLQHIASCYMTPDKLAFNMIERTGIKVEADLDKLKDPKVLGIIYDNIVRWFINIMKPHLAKRTKLKFKFHRQSEAKEYIILPPYRSLPTTLKEPIFTNFCADMKDVVKCGSIRYSAYELGVRKDKEGINRANPYPLVVKPSDNKLPFSLEDDD